jgi:ATP-dependent 26S proteasome regulatory subunit
LHQIIPFGSRYVRDILGVKGSRIKLPMSYLYYGPSGTGKTLMVRAVATETRSLVFDLTL